VLLRGRRMGEYPDRAPGRGQPGWHRPARVYEGLGVREVWFWKEGCFELHTFNDGACHQVDRSALIPSLDFEALARFVQIPDQYPAVVEYRAWLRATG
jgi:hypothetical protein